MTDPKGVETNKVRVFCRFNYLNIFSPDPFYDGQEKYTATLLISKTDTEAVEVVKKAIKNAASSITGLVLSKDNQPLKDGDANKPDSPAFAGVFYVNAKSNTKPKVKRKEQDGSISNIGPDDIKDGDYGYAIISINPYAGKQGGKPGVGAYLNTIIWAKAGDPLASGLSDDEMFDGLEAAETGEAPGVDFL